MYAKWKRLGGHPSVRAGVLLILCGMAAARAEAQQEPPYFVTYSSVMEEPGNLEIENQNVTAAGAERS